MEKRSSVQFTCVFLLVSLMDLGFGKLYTSNVVWSGCFNDRVRLVMICQMPIHTWKKRAGCMTNVNVYAGIITGFIFTFGTISYLLFTFFAFPPPSLPPFPFLPLPPLSPPLSPPLPLPLSFPSPFPFFHTLPSFLSRPSSNLFLSL